MFAFDYVKLTELIPTYCIAAWKLARNEYSLEKCNIELEWTSCENSPLV